jgi:peptidoglycan/LPS O-acetylase OafA/YrhL
MKKSIIVLITASVVLIATGVWISSTSEDFKPFDMLNFCVLILIVSLAVLFGYRRYSSVRRGEPLEDELSKKIIQKTASLSYYISLYLWLALMYFSDKMNYETHTIIGAGMFGMALTFVICWLLFKFTGLRNE